MSCLIHHFSHSVRSTYLTYSHFYYLHLSIPYILYHLYFIFHFSLKSFISNLSSVYFFNISIPYIYIHMRCWTKLFCQGKKNVHDFQSLCLILFHADYQLCLRNILVICFQDIFRLTRYDLLLKQSICRSLFTKSGLLFFCNLCFLLKARIPGIKKELLLLIFFLYSDCLFHKQGSGRWIFFLHIKCNPPWEKGHNAKQEHLEQRKKGHL